MSVQEQITRISAAKTDIAAAITAKGVSVPATAKLDALAGYVAQISIGASFALLWSNPTPTATFAPQTLALSLGDYDMYLLVARHSTAIEGTVSVMTPTGCSARLQSIGASEVGSAVVDAAPVGYWTAMRTAAYSDGSLVFTDAVFSAVVNNDYIIPLYVYGIKGVTT